MLAVHEGLAEAGCDPIRTGTDAGGTHHVRPARLGPAQRAEVRRRFTAGETRAALARSHAVNISPVRMVERRMAWPAEVAG